MVVTYITSNAVGIGEASRRTGVPVRTIRFYCDEGILAAQRTSGGHRMFTPEALDRLVLVRQLRAVGLGLATIADVLAGERAVPEAVRVERAAVEADLAALSWRHAVLVAIEQADDPLMLTELAAVAERGAVRTTLIDFWRRVLAAMPALAFDDFVEMDIPRLPAAPAPRHVLLFAELGQLARSAELMQVTSRQIWGAGESVIRNRRAFLADLVPAHTAAAQRMIADDPPEPGPELDLYIAAHATARGRRDTEGFRRELARGVSITDRATARYWTLTAEALGSAHTTGGVQRWLDTALLRSLEPSGG
ncbi:MerR family transcriptional regulator [Nocardia carnea]|uniref:MerR family transcriptional regulator n=1 Tax=Nocardia carnea TaxID=37328 RepID=A0ABW7TJV8_9NOCA|nr:MerR family transcriptional regulator [Nocardia carnea]